MTLHTPILIGPGVGDPTIYSTQQEFRMFIDSLIQLGIGAPSMTGVVGSGALQVVQHGSGNMSVDVNSGRAFIQDQDITNGGTYWVWNDSTYNLTVPTAPGSGTENHRIVLQLRNKGENGNYTTYDFQPQLLADTGSGTPAVPNSALDLAIVSVPAGTTQIFTSNITDDRARVDTIVRVTTADVSNATTSFANGIDPTLVAQVGANCIYDVDFFAVHDGPSNIGVDWQFTGPAGSLMSSFVPPQQNGASGGPYLPFNDYGLSSIITPVICNSPNNNFTSMLKGTLVTGNAPGLFQFQFCQSGSSSTAVRRRARSHMILRRIG